MSATETLPGLDSAYSITPEDVAAYRRDGHLLLRGVASPAEVAAYRPAIVEAAEAFRQTRKPLEERDTYGRAFLQLINLWERDDRVARFVLARRFAQVAAELMEVEAVRIYHDQALFKEPGGGHTPWHQDQFYWPIDQDRTITMWMPLSDTTPEMGTMRFASGSQHGGPMDRVEISDSSDEVFQRAIAEKGWAITQPTAMTAGDATFHSGWVLHAAGSNSTGRMREAMTVIYYADGCRVVEPEDDWRRADLEAFFPGLQPGDLCASPKNPLVYRR